MTEQAQQHNTPPGGIPERRKTSDHEAYFNAGFDAEPVYLEPGQTAWGNSEKEMIIATVGSGVVVSVHDSELRIGAVGYVLIPDELLEVFPHFEKADQKILDRAFQPIVDCIGHMKRHGAAKNRIWVRLMGGAKLPGDDDDRGTKNYVFTREYITRKGLAVLNEDMGGSYIRRVHFFPTTGRAVRRMLRRGDDFEALKKTEEAFQASLKK